VKDDLDRPLTPREVLNECRKIIDEMHEMYKARLKELSRQHERSVIVLMLGLVLIYTIHDILAVLK